MAGWVKHISLIYNRRWSYHSPGYTKSAETKKKIDELANFFYLRKLNFYRFKDLKSIGFSHSHLNLQNFLKKSPSILIMTGTKKP